MKHLILIIALLPLVGCKSKEAAVSESLKVEETKIQRVEEKLSSMLGLTIDSIVISLASPPALPSREGAKREGDCLTIGLKPYAELYRPYGAEAKANEQLAINNEQLKANANANEQLTINNEQLKANAKAKAKANAELYRTYSAKIYGIKAVKHDTLWREKIRRDTIIKVETAVIKEEQIDGFSWDRKIVLLCSILGIILVLVVYFRKTGG